MLGGFIMTADVACQFFQRCIEREAIKPEERMAILKELVEEHKAKALSVDEIKETVKDKTVLQVKRANKK